MDILALSNHVVLAAIVGGTISAGSNSVIADLANVYVLNTQPLSIKSMLSKSVISSLTLGLLLSVIFYAFAVYAYPNAIITPVQIIELFTLFFGFGLSLIRFIFSINSSRTIRLDFHLVWIRRFAFQLIKTNQQACGRIS